MTTNELVAYLQAVGVSLWVKENGRLGIGGNLDMLSGEIKGAIRSNQAEMVGILAHAKELRAGGKVAMTVRWAKGEKGLLELENPLTGETVQVIARGAERWLFDRLPSKYDI